ncbi:LptF/LptG family permease [Candidatus Pelagibacter sp.]|nr:LptF/LptG family permease [Candidatus Pelagibacter sp.]
MKLYFKYLMTISIVFLCLIFVLNIIEEIKFFDDLNLSFLYPVIFTLLNLPTILFEISPFIFLITTQMFFLELYNRDEIIIFKQYGVKNLDIIKFISFISLIVGILLVLGFYTLSSNLKNNYLIFKNKFTDDNKYLAVINESGLWIKDEVNDYVNIVHAKSIEKNFLKDVSINQMDKDHSLVQSIFAEEIDIMNNTWKIENAKIFNVNGTKIDNREITFKTNFNLEKINNLFSNLSSLNLIQLFEQYNDYKSLGYSTLDIESHIHKITSLPIYLVIMILLGSILMFNTSYNKSKVANLVIGILLSVFIYYINYFFNLMGINERIPVILSVWFPFIILILLSGIGLVKINEK